MLAALTTVKDVALGLSPRLPGDGRFGIGSLTPALLTEAVGGGTPGARVVGIELERDRGTTDRARIALQWNDAGTTAGLPTAVFAKGTASMARSRILNAAFGLCETEVRFYSTAYPDLASLTLRPYLASVGRGGRFTLVLESAEEGTHFYQPQEEAGLEHAEAVVDALASMHAAFYESPRFAGDLAWVTPYRGRPGQVLAPRAVLMAEKRFFATYDAPSSVRRLTRLHLGRREDFWRIWEAMPATLCHGDTHIGNTFRTDGAEGGRSGLFDWQEVHRMNGIRDVAYFIAWAFEPESRRTHERALLRRYLDGLVLHGAERFAPEEDEAFDQYRLMMLDAWTSVWAALGLMDVDDETVPPILLRRQYALLEDLDVEEAMAAALSRPATSP